MLRAAQDAACTAARSWHGSTRTGSGKGGLGQRRTSLVQRCLIQLCRTSFTLSCVLGNILVQPSFFMRAQEQEVLGHAVPLGPVASKVRQGFRAPILPVQPILPVLVQTVAARLKRRRIQSVRVLSLHVWVFASRVRLLRLERRYWARRQGERGWGRDATGPRHPAAHTQQVRQLLRTCGTHTSLESSALLSPRRALWALTGDARDG